uniref:Uncharacterized protein n=1 Tax=Romanomermis culicivorax TaxID=13658 RepID=A0A915IHU1_ROMCU
MFRFISEGARTLDTGNTPSYASLRAVCFIFNLPLSIYLLNVIERYRMIKIAHTIKRSKTERRCLSVDIESAYGKSKSKQQNVAVDIFAQQKKDLAKISQKILTPNAKRRKSPCEKRKQ